MGLNASGFDVNCTLADFYAARKDDASARDLLGPLSIANASLSLTVRGCGNQ
jgi:hypothetical protein